MYGVICTSLFDEVLILDFIKQKMIYFRPREELLSDVV